MNKVQCEGAVGDKADDISSGNGNGRKFLIQQEHSAE